MRDSLSKRKIQWDCQHTYIIMSGSADKSVEILKKNLVVTGTSNANFTQYRHLRYFDEKVNKTEHLYTVKHCNNILTKKGVIIMKSNTSHTFGCYSPGLDKKTKGVLYKFANFFFQSKLTFFRNWRRQRQPEAQESSSAGKIQINDKCWPKEHRR